MKEKLTNGRQDVVKTFAINSVVVLAAFLTFISFFYVSANINSESPRITVKEAFDDGVITYDIYRLLEAIPGFIVTESDNAGSCYMYGHMLAPPESLFGLGARSADTSLMNCEALEAVVQEADSPATYISYYRYWQGAAAISKVALSVMNVSQFQWLLTILLAVLSVALSIFAWRRSRILGLGFLVTFAMTTDFLWQGFSPLHGVATVVGLGGALVVYAAFSRSWSTRWAWVVVAGMAYAMFAHTLIPMAMLLLTYMAAFLASRATNHKSKGRALLSHLGLPLLWIIGYLIGSVSRWVWTSTLGPGLPTLRSEFAYSSEKFITTSPIDPFYQLIGLLTKTWLEFGVMQVGLIVTTLLIGASWGRQLATSINWATVGIWISPVVYPLVWLSIFAFHTNHTYVHAVLSMALLLVLYSLEMARLINQRGLQGDADEPRNPQPTSALTQSS